MSNESKSKATVGRLMSQDEVKQLSDLRESLKPEASWNRLDGFGKWIFSVVATVGVLGAGFSNSAFQQLSVEGKAVFSIAIMLIGVGLAFAVRGLTPMLMSVSTSSIDSMREAISLHIRNRQRMLEWAGILLGLSLALAALAPLLSSPPARKAEEKPQLSVAFDVNADGKVIVDAKGSGLKPLTPVEVAFVAKPPISAVLPRTRGIAGTDGKVVLKIELPNATKLKSKLYAVSGWSATPANSQTAITENHQEIEIPFR